MDRTRAPGPATAAAASGDDRSDVSERLQRNGHALRDPRGTEPAASLVDGGGRWDDDRERLRLVALRSDREVHRASFGCASIRLPGKEAGSLAGPAIHLGRRDRAAVDRVDHRHDDEQVLTTAADLVAGGEGGRRQRTE